MQIVQKMTRKLELGGNLSVRMHVGTKPIVILGHDKCIFKQYQFTNKLWDGDNKEHPILPKDKGASEMVRNISMKMIQN